MTLSTDHLKDRKTYVTELKATLKANRSGKFQLVEFKFGDNPAAPVLLVGPKLDELKKHVAAKKAKVLDSGGYKEGVFAGTTGKLTAEVLAKLQVGDDLASVAAVAGDAPKATSKMPAPDTPVPSINMTVKALLKQVAADKTAAGQVDHPVMKTALLQLVQDVTDAVNQGDLKDAARVFQQLRQADSDAAKAPEAKATLARIKPVADAHAAQEAKDLYKQAQALYDAGNILGCNDIIQRITKKFGHDPYADKASGVTQGVGTGVRLDAAAAAQLAGSLSRAYDKAKKDLEAKIAKVNADRTKFVGFVAGSDAASAFLKDAATKGLRARLEAIEVAVGAKRTALVEKAILVVQDYITDLSARKAAGQLSVDFLAMLRFLHAEMKRLHH